MCCRESSDIVGIVSPPQHRQLISRRHVIICGLTHFSGCKCFASWSYSFCPVCWSVDRDLEWCVVAVVFSLNMLVLFAWSCTHPKVWHNIFFFNWKVFLQVLVFQWWNALQTCVMHMCECSLHLTCPVLMLN